MKGVRPPAEANATGREQGHAPAEANATGREQGHAPAEANATGREQGHTPSEDSATDGGEHYHGHAPAEANATSGSNMEYKLMYRRNLPHYQPKNGLLFVTFRLNFRVPEKYIRAYNDFRESLDAQLDNREPTELERIVRQKKLFDFVDNYYSEIHDEIDLTQPPEIAALLADFLCSLHSEYYVLYAFTIMPNHVHILLKPLSIDEKYLSLAEIMHKIKGSSARQINLVLQRQGRFWQREYYDHWVRTDQEMWNVVEYIRQNPVRAKLASDPESWQWTWINPELGRKI